MRNNAEKVRKHIHDDRSGGPITASEIRDFLACSTVGAHKLVNKAVKDGWLRFEYLPRPKGKPGPPCKSYFLNVP